MSLVFNQKIALDLTISRVQNVHCSQDDDNSRNILVTLSDNGKPYILSSNEKIFLKISKPDDTFVYIDEDDSEHLYRNDDGTISIILSDQATCVPGICEAELQIIDSAKVVSTRKFNIIVKHSVVSDKEIESQIETNIIKKIIQHLTNFANPHKVNKEQVGLGNVPNVTTNDQTPTYEESNKLKNVESGETLSVAFGKIKKAIGTLMGHVSTKATTEQEGHIQLTDSISSTSITTAATPNAVKTVYDKTENIKTITNEHISDITKHIDSIERENWDVAYEHCQSVHAPVDAEANQNTFSNITINDTNISANSKTDTISFTSGDNVTITPNIKEKKIIISSAHPSISKNNDSTSSVAPSAGETFTTVDSVARDENGHVTKINTKTVTLPSTNIIVDDSLSSTSANPVQNKVITSSLDTLDYIALAESLGWNRCSVVGVSWSDLGGSYAACIPLSDCVSDETYLVKLNNGSIHKVTMLVSSVNDHQVGVYDGTVLIGDDIDTATKDGISSNPTTGKKAWITGSHQVKYTITNYSGLGAPIVISTSGTVLAWYCKISDSSCVKQLTTQYPTVTQTGQYAIDAVELNSSVDGTLANKIAAIENDIDTLTKNTRSTAVYLNAYNTADNLYTFPNDGYVCISSENVTSGFVRVALYSSQGVNYPMGWMYQTITNAYQTQTTYVRKGMKMFCPNATEGTKVIFFSF